MNQAFLSASHPARKSGLLLTLTIISMLGLLLLAGCQSADPTPGPSVPGITLEITADTCPNAVVAPNQQVTWENQDSQDHTVLDVTGNGSVLYDADVLHAGDSFSYTFINPGTYEYTCSADGNVKGQITVE